MRYLLPKDERGGMLKEHGDFGRQYSRILTYRSVDLAQALAQYPYM